MGNNIGEINRAEKAVLDILSKEPHNLRAKHLLAAIYYKKRNPQKALDLLVQLLESDPNDPDLLMKAGLACLQLNQLEQAEQYIEKSTQIATNDPQSRLLLGKIRISRQMIGPAIEAFKSSLKIHPDSPQTHHALANAYLDAGNLYKALEHFNRCASLRPNSPAMHSDLLFWLLHDPRQSHDTLFKAHQFWTQRFTICRSTAPVDEVPPATPPGEPAARERPADTEIPTGRGAGSTCSPTGEGAGSTLRVAYLSPDFRQHAVARFFIPLIQSHDPAKIFSICYADVPREDSITDLIRNSACLFRNTFKMKNQELARQIRDDRVDILIELTGHMGQNRLPLFALKPAPLQMTYLGYPHTLAMPFITHRIVDPWTDPPGLADRLHTEKLVRLNRCPWAYYADRSIARPTRDPGRGVIFGAFNRIGKVNPPMIELWAQILDKTPDAQLWIVAKGGENNAPARKLFEKSGVDGERLKIFPIQSYEEYLKLSGQLDIHLDTFPYNGMTTTFDMLWMGVPTVTLVGETHRSRVGLSLNHAVGHDEWCAQTPQQYVEIAIQLANNKPRLRRLQQELPSRFEQSPLMDGASMAHEIEAAYFRELSLWISRPGR